MKKTFLGKLLITITIIVLLLNFYLMPPVQAGWLEDMLTSVISLFTWPIRAVAIACGLGINALTAGLAYMEGTTDGSAIALFLTPFDILFNKVKLFDINFFDIVTTGVEAESLVNKIRLGIAGWYYTLRTISAMILLCILIYVGIRMAITTIATDKAMYKKMLVDWVASMLLLFLLHYIMIFAIGVNNTIVGALSSAVDSAKIEQVYTVIRSKALDPLDLNSLAATAIYCMLVWQTLGLVFSYFNRLLKLAFLTIIAPLVTITYSLDKMGDGKAQALNAWLKEYVYTILIQPFHCVIYMCLIDIGLNVLIDNAATGDDISVLAAAVISIMCVKFTKDAENIVRDIFSFADDNSTGLGAGMAAAGAGLMLAKNVGKTARSTVNGARNVARTGKDAIRGIGTGLRKGSAAMAAASGALVDKYKSKAGERYESAVDKQMDKMYGSSEPYKNSSGQYSETDKQYEARRNAAKAIVDKKIENKNNRKEKVKNKFPVKAAIKSGKAVKKVAGRGKNAIKRKVSKARKTVSKMRDIRDNSTVIKGLSDTTKVTLAAGTALFMGAGSMGVGQDPSAALLTSAAMFRGTNEFMKGTRTTLRRGVKENLQAMGINSKQAMNEKLPGILALHGNSEAAKEEESKLMKDIEKALQECGLETSNKSTIRNIVQRAAKGSPENMDRAISHALSSVVGNKNRTPEDMAGLVAATQNLSDFYNGAEVFKSFNTAAEFGLTADTFAADVMKGFYENTDAPVESSGETVVEEGVNEQLSSTSEPQQTENNSVSEGENGPVVNDEGEGITDEEYQKIQDEKQKICEQIEVESDENVKKELEEKLREYDTEMDRYIESEMTKMNTQVSEILANTEADLQTQLDTIIADFERKIGDGMSEDMKNKWNEYKNQIQTQIQGKED